MATDDQKIRFAIIGDYGQTTSDAIFPIDQVGEAIRSWHPDFILTLGDNNYALGQAKTIEVNIGKNFGEYIWPKATPNTVEGMKPSTNEAVQNRFFPVLGNHDYGDYKNSNPPTPSYIALSDPYLNYFRPALQHGSMGAWLDGRTSVTLPDKTNFHEPDNVNLRYYKLSWGPVDFFFIDSNPSTPYGHSPDGYQGKWLQGHLQASTAPWKIVIFHHPPYTSGTAGENTLYMRWPFQDWGADVVITGHVHNYERFQISNSGDNHAPENSTPYIVNGAGGFVPQEGFDPGRITSSSKIRLEEYGFQWVVADESSIALMYFDRKKVLRDTLTLYRNPADAPRIVEFDAYHAYVAQDAKMLTLDVNRGGNLSQPLDVNFATVPGTALPNIDYIPVQEKLHFDAGQAQSTVEVPILGNMSVPTLFFTAALMSPTPGTKLGTFSNQTVIIDNTADTPLQNTDAFIKRTYLDLLVREPSPDELVTGLNYLATHTKAQFVLDVVLSEANYAKEPVFKVAQIHSLIYLSPEAKSSNAMTLFTYADLEFWTGRLTLPNNPDPLWKVAQGLGSNAIELIYDLHSRAKSHTYEFLFVIYDALLNKWILPDGDDSTYWQEHANPKVTTDDQTRYAMVAQLATEVFPPQGYPNVTAFNLPKDRKLAILVAMLWTGLLPEFQLPYPIFENILRSIEQHEGLLEDLVKDLINSSEYAARFRPGPPPPPISLPSHQSITGGEPAVSLRTDPLDSQTFVVQLTNGTGRAV